MNLKFLQQIFEHEILENQLSFVELQIIIPNSKPEPPMYFPPTEQPCLFIQILSLHPNSSLRHYQSTAPFPHVHFGER